VRPPCPRPSARPGALGRLCSGHHALARAVRPPLSASVAAPGRIPAVGVARHLYGKALWGGSPRSTPGTEARADGCIRTQSDGRPDTPRTIAQSAEGGIAAVGVPGLGLPVYSATRRAPAPRGHPAGPGRRRAGPVARVAPRTIDHAADCHTVARAADSPADWPERGVACRQGALSAQPPALHRAGTLQ
jgi:hypothetical protein